MSLTSPCRVLGAILLAALLASPLAAQDPIARGVKFFQEQEFAAARRALEPYALSHPGDARAAYYLGRAYYEERDLAAAVEWLSRAVELREGDADYHLRLGNAYGMQATEANVIRKAVLARKAKQEFERAVELAPRNDEARLGLVRFYTLAPPLLGGDLGKAREHAAQLRRQNPYRSFEAFAAIHRQEGNLGTVATEYETAVRQFPDSALMYFSLGNAYLALNRFDAARAVYELLVTRKPDEMGGYYQIARIGAITGQRLDQAEAAMLRYLRHTPKKGEPALANAHWRLGQIYERRGDRARARASYRASLTLDPAYRDAQESLAKLGA